jgi:hypothetical protein
MPWTQFQDWLEFDKVEPIGGLRADWQAGMISAMMMNAAVLIRTGQVDLKFQPRDFLLDFTPKPKRAPGEAPRAPAEQSRRDGGGQTWQQQKFIAQAFAAVSRADEAKKKKRR